MTHDPAATRPSWRRPVGIALGTTVAVSALSYSLPDDYAATGVGFAFLAVTYALVLRSDDPELIRRHGLSMGGLFEPVPLVVRRLLSDTGRALLVCLLLAAIVFPPFWVGYAWWWEPRQPFVAASALALIEDSLGQVVVIALPEEAFYRGWLQTALDDVFKPRWRILGASVGPGLLLASALFGVGHYLTEPHPNRLAVFFPALLFGWLRARTGGIGAPVAFHAACNLFASYLAQSYGFRG